MKYFVPSYFKFSNYVHPNPKAADTYLNINQSQYPYLAVSKPNRPPDKTRHDHQLVSKDIQNIGH